ncbi:MAG: aminotransferase class I/II-fold pyridoxal phosphate-dependent enzyme [Clostridia bacterium]|nr:aminotransferase class I/II-fold pyridoxal phosphate-dependent enzyme [Clostridia bacterium]
MELNRRLVNTPPSGIRRIGQLAKARPGCIALSIGEPDLDAPESVRQHISDAILAGDTHYPPNAGITPLRSEIAQAVNQRFSTDYSPSETVVTIGSTEALASALFAILNPGDEVIVPIPSFGLYQPQIEMAGGVFVPLPLRGNDFQIDPQALEKSITHRTRAILFASPNNPTGTILNAESLALLRHMALAHSLFLIDDSVYDSLLYTDSFPTLMGDPALRDRLIYVNAFSKTYAMTGVRIGYALADEPVMTQMIKAHSFLVVSVAGCIQSGCRSIFSLPVDDSVSLYRERRDLVCRALGDMHLPFPVPEGAFYVFPSIREFGIPDESFCMQLIEQEGLALVPSSCFGIPGHVRISFCYETSVLEEGMRRLLRFVEALRA